MIIDCDQCEFRGTEECNDCFVMSILSRKDAPVMLEPEEEEAARSLAEAGLAPILKFKKKAG